MALLLLKKSHQLDGSLTQKRIEKTRGGLVTAREREVLQKMSEGLTVKEIAASLFVSCHTVISHKKNLVLKLDARNSIDLIVKSIRIGVVEL